MRKDLTQQRREEIIDAARKCFMSRGFHATGMTDIAREFGMSTGHIYNYFPSKLAIIEEVISRGMQEFYKSSCAIQSNLDSYEQTLKHVRNILLPLMKKERVSLSLEMLIEATHDPSLAKILQQADEKARAHLRSLRKFPPEDPKDLAELEVMMGTFEGVGIRILRNPNADKNLICEVVADRLFARHEALKAKASRVYR